MNFIFKALKQASRSLDEIRQVSRNLSEMCAALAGRNDESPQSKKPTEKAQQTQKAQTVAPPQGGSYAKDFLPPEFAQWPTTPPEPISTEWCEGEIAEPDDAVWCEEEIPEPPIVDVKVVTLVDETTGAVSQQVEVATTQPAKVKVATQVKMRATSWFDREYDGIKCDTQERKYAQAFPETSPVGLDSRELTEIICAVECDRELAAYDQMDEMMSTTSQIVTYKRLCQLCEQHGITYGKQRPFDYQEYALAIMALTRLLERKGVIAASRSRRSWAKAVDDTSID